MTMTTTTSFRPLVAILVGLLLGSGSGRVLAQTEELRAAVDQLGDFDYAIRMEASRTLRRAEPELVVPLLLEAIRSHEDSYVQFRAIVLVYGFDLPRSRAVFDEALESRNDRVRAAAYEYFEQFPSRAVVPKLLSALDDETSEFVRPYLVRALAANDETQEAQDRLVREIGRGEGYFRGAVIEALGDHDADYAVDALITIASEDGPLRDDALLALGKIADSRAAEPLTAIQAEADEALQPVVSATACLLGLNCAGQFAYVADALSYAAQVEEGDRQELLRAAATGLAALAIAGNPEALGVLFDVGVTAADAARAPIAISLGTVALRNPTLVRAELVERAQRASDDASALDRDLLLLRDAFDILDEDFAEERFYVLMREDYWTRSDDPAIQNVAEAAIRILEF